MNMFNSNNYHEAKTRQAYMARKAEKFQQAAMFTAANEQQKTRQAHQRRTQPSQARQQMKASPATA